MVGRTEFSFKVRSISRMRLLAMTGSVMVGCRGSQPLTESNSVFMASSAELERPKTINRYF